MIKKSDNGHYYVTEWKCYECEEELTNGGQHKPDCSVLKEFLELTRKGIKLQ